MLRQALFRFFERFMVNRSGSESTTEPPYSSLQKIAANVTSPRVVSAWRQNASNRYLGFLPLLEHALSDVLQEFPAVMKALGVDEEIRDSLSIDELILYALDRRSQWGAMAVAWLEQGAALDEKIVAAIDHAVAEKYWTQKDRHIAFRLAQRWKRKDSLIKDINVLLDQLCQEWGFCNALTGDQLVTSAKEVSADHFAEAVLTAEGMNPEYELEWRRRIRAKFVDRYGATISPEIYSAQRNRADHQ